MARTHSQTNCKLSFQNNLLCTYQNGGIPNSGTEDTILQLINTIEDSSERAQNLEILAFDKAKAFDSPGRIGGISLAWQRLGLPKHIANYIVTMIIAYFHELHTTLHPKQKPLILPFMPQWAHHKGAAVQASPMLQLKT